MPAYNFKKQFVPLIQDGRKIHTLRAIRKNPAKPGDILYLYSGMRTKDCAIIIDPLPCVQAKTLFMFPGEKRGDADVILLDDILDKEDSDRYIENINELISRPDALLLNYIQKTQLAYNDGFRDKTDPDRMYGCWDIMENWIVRQYGNAPFAGHLSYWAIGTDMSY